MQTHKMTCKHIHHQKFALEFFFYLSASTTYIRYKNPKIKNGFKYSGTLHTQATELFTDHNAVIKF